MKITKLEFENFRTHKGKFEYQNLDELNLISGDNGAGKSSIQKFVDFIIFGTTDKKIEDFINWDCNYFEGTLDFEHDGSVYENFIRCETNGKTLKTTRKLVIDNKKDETYNNSDATKKLAEIFDPIVSSIMFTRQNEQSFLNSSASSRRDILKKIFDLDFKKEAKEIEEEFKNLITKSDVLASEISNLKAKVYDYNIEQKPNITESEYADNLDKVKILESKVDDLKIRISEITRLRDEYANLDGRRLRLNTNIDTLKSDIDKISRVIDLKKSEISELEESIPTIKTEMEAKAESLRAKFTEEDSRLQIQRLKVVDKSVYETLKDEISEVRAKYRAITVKINDCKSGKCPTCGKDYDKIDTSEYEKEKDELDLKLNELQAKYDEAYKDYEVYQSKLRLNEETKNKKEKLKSDLERDLSLLDVETKISNIKDKIKLKNEELNINSKNLESKTSDINNALAEIDEISLSLSKIKIENKFELELDKSDLEVRIKLHKDENYEFDRIRAYNEAIKVSNIKIKEQEEKDKIELSDKLQQKTDIDTNVEELKEVRNILLKDFPTYVISTVISDIQNFMNEFVDKVYYKSLNIEIIENGDSIDVNYGEGKRKIDTSLASGAESQILNLSYKAALSEYFNNTIMLLDEIDSNLSSDNSLRLADAILEMRDKFEQIFIITHNNDTKDVLIQNSASLLDLDM